MVYIPTRYHYSSHSAIDIFTTLLKEAEESSINISLASDISTDLLIIYDLPANDYIAYIALNPKGPSGLLKVKLLRINGKLNQEKD